MKMKLTTLLFGLLLAVGWTNDALAQLRPEYEKAQTEELTEGQGVRKHVKAPVSPAFANAQAYEVGPMMRKGQSSSVMRAPRRAVNSPTADAVHPRSWYDDYYYIWYEGTRRDTACLTDVVENAYQMYYLTKSTYITPEIPGILYSGGWDDDVSYPGIKYGYDIYGTRFNDIRLRLTTSNVLVRYIEVRNAANDNTIVDWSGGSLSSVGWSSNPALQSTSVSGSGSSYTWYYMNGGGTITIPHNLFDGVDSVYIRVTARKLNESDEGELWWHNRYLSNTSLTTTSTTFKFKATYGGLSDAQRPNENGYTIFLVKLKDTDFTNPPKTTASMSELVTFFNTYVQSMEILTDGMRVEEGTDQAGTVFAYSGVLDKFYFIGKGKMYWASGDPAPFYSMYEEFSPDQAGPDITNSKDLYANMRAGQYYYIRHDCQGVINLNHYFSMAGKDTIAPKGVDPLIFYIPDNRGAVELGRTYREDIRPQVGLYQIDLSAEAMQSVTYAQDSTYTVYLEWSSTLNNMTNSEIEQTYIIYTVTYDSIGTRIYTPLDTVYNETTYQYDVPQQQTSQTIHYVVMGYPTDATNNPENQPDGGIFYTYSNLDDVQIPGWFDFMVLYRERYESDFVIHEEKNYYRNYLYPTNLAANTGMTMEQLKHEWPNQTASYTLWRDNTGIAVLEVRAIGKKVYYRIRYYDDTQVKTGPNNIEMNYQTIND